MQSQDRSSIYSCACVQEWGFGSSNGFRRQSLSMFVSMLRPTHSRTATKCGANQLSWFLSNSFPYLFTSLFPRIAENPPTVAVFQPSIRTCYASRLWAPVDGGRRRDRAEPWRIQSSRRMPSASRQRSPLDGETDHPTASSFTQHILLYIYILYNIQHC